MVDNLGGVLVLGLDFHKLPSEPFLLSFLLLLLPDVVDDDNGDTPGIIDTVLVLVVVGDDDLNPFLLFPEDDVEDLVKSFPDAEDDSMSAMSAQSPKSRVCRATSDGSVEGWMSSLPSPWIFLFCAGL